MRLPKQTAPVKRNTTMVGTQTDGSAIQASGFFCGVCQTAVGGIMNSLIGEGCAEASAAFEVACNAAFDVESVGAASIPCTAAAGVLLAACEAGGGQVTQSIASSVTNSACSWAC